MNILKEVLKHEVFPALGCTEPIAVAYAASIAAGETEGEIEEIRITVDPGVYKNGLAVTIPNTGGETGNLIAGVLGALVRKPELKMEVLTGATDDMKIRAQALIREQKATITYDKSKKTLYIDVTVITGNGHARAVITDSHTNLVLLEKNDRIILEKNEKADKAGNLHYRTVLRNMKISELIDLADNMDDADYAYIKQGVEMNIRASGAGKELKKVGYYLDDLVKKGYLLDDVFSSSKILTASASDARMAGMNFPVMSSGGSGNQGIVAILVPYNVGTCFKVEEKRILRSIALSHLINSYIKCFTGDLCPLCGCSIAAGAGAAVAIVYQLSGKDLHKIALSVNNLISDLGGMLCDGAKPGCALKVVSSTDSAIRSAYMALNNHGITELEGFIGKTAEETIFHLSRISEIGMALVDDTILGIMKEKMSGNSSYR
ncbi:L-serine ammonia-lyase, iron-sulfur-dependent, subunit alpha [bacterium]|nr:L-serine ammonia-lyase, iron-sulfur-dependent, subunit alpha [bacterium]